MTTEIDAEGLAAAHAAYAKTTGGTMDGHPMENAIRAYLTSRSTSEAEPVAGCTCQKCGRVYIGDLLVPDDVWAKISPVPVDGDKSGGLLCATCIVDGIVSAGLATVVYALPTPASDDQVEAVARALYEENDACSAGRPWPDLSGEEAEYRRLARAALLAAMGSTKP